MATVKNIHSTDDITFTLTLDDGTEATLTPAMAGIIKERMLMQELRCGITNILDDEIASGYIDMSKHQFSRADFEEEVFCDLEDDISCGDYHALSNDGEEIRERITDLANFYGLEPDEEE